MRQKQIIRKLELLAELLEKPPARWECKTLTHCTDEQLSGYLNEGWVIQHQQFVPLHGQITAGKASVALCVVLRRERREVTPMQIPPAPKRVTPTHVTLKQVQPPSSYDLNISYSEALERRYPAEALRVIADEEAKRVFVAQMEASAKQREATRAKYASLGAGA